MAYIKGGILSATQLNKLANSSGDSVKRIELGLFAIRYFNLSEPEEERQEHQDIAVVDNNGKFVTIKQIQEFLHDGYEVFVKNIHDSTPNSEGSTMTSVDKYEVIEAGYHPRDYMWEISFFNPSTSETKTKYENYLSNYSDWAEIISEIDPDNLEANSFIKFDSF